MNNNVLRIPVKIMIDIQLIKQALQSHKRHSRENSSRKMIEINLGFFIHRVLWWNIQKCNS